MGRRLHGRGYDCVGSAMEEVVRLPGKEGRFNYTHDEEEWPGTGLTDPTAECSCMAMGEGARGEAEMEGKKEGLQWEGGRLWSSGLLIRGVLSALQHTRCRV